MGSRESAKKEKTSKKKKEGKGKGKGKKGKGFPVPADEEDEDEDEEEEEEDDNDTPSDYEGESLTSENAFGHMPADLSPAQMAEWWDTLYKGHRKEGEIPPRFEAKMLMRNYVWVARDLIKLAETHKVELANVVKATPDDAQSTTISTNLLYGLWNLLEMTVDSFKPNGALKGVQFDDSEEEGLEGIGETDVLEDGLADGVKSINPFKPS